MKTTSIKKIDKPFLSKFFKGSVYFDSKNEFYKSIVREIQNILESNLKIDCEYMKSNLDDVPFLYGTRDLQSVDVSTDELIKFKFHCKIMILKLEPRLSNIEFTNVNINKEKQSINLNMICYLKNNNEKFNSEIKVFT